MARIKKIQLKITSIKKKILPILRRYPVTQAGLFGSVVSGNYRRLSDIDILVKIAEGSGMSLFDLVGMQMDLEKVLKRKVDLVEYKTVKPALKDFILPNEIRIYETDHPTSY